MTRPVSKPGKHGTLYLYRVSYCDGVETCDGMRATPDPAAPPMYVDVWAYDTEHAMEKVDSPEEG